MTDIPGIPPRRARWRRRVLLVLLLVAAAAWTATWIRDQQRARARDDLLARIAACTGDGGAADRATIAALRRYEADAGVAERDEADLAWSRRGIALLAARQAAAGRRGEPRPLVHRLFNHHMVLQRGRPVPIWGWTDAGATVTVTIGTAAVGDAVTVTTSAAADGRWQAALPAHDAGGPWRIVVSAAGRRQAIDDVLFGEVWLCAGQSNMGLPLAEVAEPAEMASADCGQLRLFTVPATLAYQPAEQLAQSDLGSRWHPCTPASAAGFSAVAYHFGRELNARLGVPVGLVCAAWGGTAGQCWTSAGTLAGLDGYAGELAQVDRLAQLFTLHAAGVGDHGMALAAWYADHDRGQAAVPAWSDPALDDRAWPAMAIPAPWEEAGLPAGMVWFRRTIELPPDWTDRDATLHLGAIGDADTVFINGCWIGGQEARGRRDYPVPASALHAGTNLLAVRVVGRSSPCGMLGPAGDLVLETADRPALPLAGSWHYRVSRPLIGCRRLPSDLAPDAQHGSVLYNGMIAPLAPAAIAGVIWYQGEADVEQPGRYRRLLPALIGDWRRLFGAGTPFHLVQLPNHHPPAAQPGESQLASLREAQAEAARLPGCAYAVTIDIGDAASNHPRNKRDVGRRLALGALARVYGLPIAGESPCFRAMTVTGAVARIAFDHADGGLVAHDPTGAPADRITGFAIAGFDGHFVWAEARLDGDGVVVGAPAIARPTAVRYGWADNPGCNLYGRSGLPVAPFRSDAPP